MVILGVPYNTEDYLIADDRLGFILQQKGAHPAYRDGVVLYFKRSSKLQKILGKLGLEL